MPAPSLWIAFGDNQNTEPPALPSMPGRQFALHEVVITMRESLVAADNFIGDHS
jgi:hypothetical protein